MRRSLPATVAVAVALAAVLFARPAAAETPVVKENHFAALQKVFAGLASLDPAKGEIEFVEETTGKMARLPLRPDAEFLRRGGPGSAADFAGKDAEGLRIWVWITPDDKGRRLDVRLVADEISAAALHRQRHVFDGLADDGKWKLSGAVRGSPKSLSLEAAEGLKPPAPGTKLLIQTAFGGKRTIREALTDADLDKARREQFERTDKRLAEAGVPARLNLSEDLLGELGLTVWRPGDRWVRALAPGDKVQVVPAGGGDAVPAVVKGHIVRGERTRLTLLAEGKFHGRLAVGSVVALKFPRPKLPADLDEPPDLDHERPKEERIVWLQSQIHCTCPSGGEVCAGDFLTLWSCNGHLCGHPAVVAKRVTAWIEEGKTDRRILDLLRDSEGPECLRPHLRP
jgi:hypothetical protein